jgi:hypothetical protein
VLTNLAFSYRPVLLGDARKIVMVADVDAKFICNKEQRGWLEQESSLPR